ncbi:PorT family protein [Porphyromonadaceae bacterium OttesenSCG-928-L07]|nr:PorT family protein [Porphyromonadaceae bacterium OttesenSCG-928-L07]MDL2252256.1 PorT family protein [Odoribacter sp. OttesenSCG-928-J03]MDL2330811.1 PorT family protein [Odoribacter sp. OttesenSCG-928-A06]
MKHKLIFIALLLVLSSLYSKAQLVTRKDYDLAIAVQAGLNMSIAIPDNNGIAFQPAYGLKLTIPFTRKYFLGSEINYVEHRYNNKQGEDKVALKYRKQDLSIPVYFKYMLNSNTNSLLLGGYFSYAIERKFLSASGSEKKQINTWDAGIIAGFEQNITRNLYVTFKVSAGIKELLKKEQFDKKYYPLQVGLTVGYTFVRFGDCGCH